MSLTRRSFLKAGLMGVTGLALPVGITSIPAARLVAASSVRSPSVEMFSVPLPIPPVLEPSHGHGDADHYEITQKVGRQEILPGFETEVWGYDGIFPGPTIAARSGRRVVVRQINELPVPTVVHLHGGVVPPESDGYPTDFILPKGESGVDESGSTHGDHAHHGDSTRGHRDYEYPNDQRAATLWYHDHRMDFTGPQVYKGLFGMYLLRDEVEDELPLPQGEKDIPLEISDRTFLEDGSFYYPSLDPTLMKEPGVLASTTADAANGLYAGMFGDTILVNGAPWPYLEVSNTLHRFRILNASNARPYELKLEPEDGEPRDGSSEGPFIQVGSDGGLLEAPISHERLLISPAERFDVVIDFSSYPVGTEVTLRNVRGEGRTADVMRFVVARGEREESEVPQTLAPPLEFPDPDESERTRQMSFISGVLGAMSTINGKVFDPERIDADPRLGATEIWEIFGDPSHPFHTHLVHFKVLSRDGGPPGPYDAGWKDTVFMEGGSVRVIAKFEGWKGKYVFHCHNLEHEDMMMMANFEVV